MWFLASTKDADQTYYLAVGKDHVVGRKDCDILIQNDQSISRKHSILSVSHPESNLPQPQTLPDLTLKDSSKYGTFINGNKAEVGSSIHLKHGDQIMFGCLKSNEWKVQYEPIVVCSSCLNKEDKKAVKEVLQKLGGYLVSDWTNDSTHLVMSKLDITVKVISALITCHPIVRPEFFHRTLTAVEQKTKLPDSKDFLPPLTDAAIKKDDISFVANKRRKTIFQELTFIFLTQKQFKRLNQTISFGGGRAILMEEGSDDGSDDVLVLSSTCVMYADPHDNTQQFTQNAKEWITHVMDHLERNNLRPIQDAEIGLAVLHCSCDLHCNPRVSQAGVNLMQPLPSQTLETQDVLAPETEPSQSRTQRPSTSASVIPSTAESVRSRDKQSTQTRESSQLRTRVKKERMSGDQDVSRIRESDSNGAGDVSSNVSKISETLQSSKKEEISMKPSPRKGSITSYFGSASSKRKRDTEDGELMSVKQSKSQLTRHDTYEFQSQTDTGNQPQMKQTKLVKEEIATGVSPRKKDISEKKAKKEMAVVETDGKNRNETKSKETQRAETIESAMPTVKRKRENVIDDDDDDEEHLWSKRRNIKQEVVENYGVASEELYADNTRPRNTEIPIGFITTTRPMQEQVMVNKNLEYTAEEELPRKLVVIEEKSLVVRRAKPQRAVVNDGGQPVKNFKKFKKAFYPGMNSLPRIIGGSDLEVHSNKQNREVEEWFREQVQADSQEDRVNSMATDLFNWEPKTKKSRRR
ncbi:nibrin-like isoform X2 [Ptychodera flava]|uniref:nibrin-like isoform X2 n=1 Tax=Ptychodera flava TaxID=63121 RepID=UPI00396A6CEF